MARPRVVLIFGPTASGKSALAARLASTVHGAVINADSMQLYRDLAVLTSRPDAAEEAETPHLLFGHVDGAVPYSAGLWLDDARAALDATERAGRLPIFVGGTGLYFKALTQGLSAIPPVPPAVRQRLRGLAAGLPAADLHTLLASRDEAMAARLRPSDPQRILRALEVFEATGQSLLAFQERREPALIAVQDSAAIFLAVERSTLKRQIAARFEVMLKAGALQEVERLRARDLDPGLPVMRALGVPPLIAHLEGKLTLAEAAAQAVRETARYAKRQVTFGRHQLDSFAPVIASEAEAFLLKSLD
ncbi:MAG TPA: tRNA (adenosine(37)-N6)-dimethylallyltransferase MiaA [Methylocella sp.]|nr:tRNA (adenosine(37)-N6)-dimethylallyltransferase MiaA [Methylocella sp.]